MTPYDVVTRSETARPGTKAELIALSRRLERAALDDPPAAVVAALQDARFVTDRTRASYSAIAERGADVRLLARGIQSWLAPGVRGVDLADEDPLADLWCVVLPSPGAPAVLAATDLHVEDVADEERTFRWALSRDRDVVAECLRLLD